MIYRVFTDSSQAPFFDLQGFYRVKSGPLFRFTGFLQSQARPPFIIYRVFTGSNLSSFFNLQAFYSKLFRGVSGIFKYFFTCCLRDLLSNIYRLFTKKIL